MNRGLNEVMDLKCLQGMLGFLRQSNLRAKYITQLLSALFLLVALAACSNPNAPLKWTEDVRLPDGRIVTLTRYQEFKGPHELGDTPSESDYWFEFKHPDTGEVIRWQSDRDLRTLALMMDGKVPILLTRPAFGISMRRYKCPNPPYLLFRFEGAWKQVSVEQIPVKRLRVNMTFGASDSRKLIESSQHRLTDKQTSNSEDDHRPFIINFSLMKEQTFDYENCDHPRNYLIEK